jgi:hypothetical protein
MTRIPCPHCGELLACSEDGIGRKVRCPRCRVMLRLDADADGRPARGGPRRRFPLLWLAAVLVVFVTGLGIGFVCGHAAGSRPAPGGVSATSVGVFSASNVIVSDTKVVGNPPPAQPGPPPVKP